MTRSGDGARVVPDPDLPGHWPKVHLVAGEDGHRTSRRDVDDGPVRPRQRPGLLRHVAEPPDGRVAGILRDVGDGPTVVLRRPNVVPVPPGLAREDDDLAPDADARREVQGRLAGPAPAHSPRASREVRPV